ncbi:transposase [Pseudonocardia xishanensis]|uniref:transposase n=1 Tax=Pseudonocardia xishanensis TaxID=630995 RepID=UPI0031F186E8
MLDAKAAPDGGGGNVFKRIGGQWGISPETLCGWVKQVEIDNGGRPGTTIDGATRLAELEREVRELRRANAILESKQYVAVRYGERLVEVDALAEALHADADLARQHAGA